MRQTAQSSRERRLRVVRVLRARLLHGTARPGIGGECWLGLDDKGKYKLKDVANKVREICERYGFDVDPNKKVYDMSVGEKQTVMAAPA